MNHQDAVLRCFELGPIHCFLLRQDLIMIHQLVLLRGLSLEVQDGKVTAPRLLEHVACRQL